MDYTVDIPRERPRHVEVLEELKSIKTEMHERFIEMGALLLEARKQKFARKWGYATLDDFTEKELGFSGRTGRGLVAVYEKFLLELEVNHTTLAQVGWTKAQELVPIVNNANADRWLNFAVKQSVKMVKLKVSEELGDDGKERKQVRDAWTVLVTPGQRTVINDAIESAKRVTGKDIVGDALEAICANFLSEFPWPPPEGTDGRRDDSTVVILETDKGHKTLAH